MNFKTGILYQCNPTSRKSNSKANHQRNSPDHQEVTPRVLLPEDPNADGHREPETRDEGLARAPEGDLPWEVGVPVQRRGVRGEEEADEDVADDKAAGCGERVGAAEEVDSEVDEFGGEGSESEAGWTAPEDTVHSDEGEGFLFSGRCGRSACA